MPSKGGGRWGGGGRTPMDEGMVGLPAARCALAHASFTFTAGLSGSARGPHYESQIPALGTCRALAVLQC